MNDVRFRHPTNAVHRSRRGAARLLARAAIAFIIIPVLLGIIESVLATFWLRFFAIHLLEAWFYGWLVLAPAASIASFLAGRRVKLRIAEVGFDGARLALGDRVIDRRDIVSAYRIVGSVDIALANGDTIDIAFDRPERARALVEALGFTGDARRASMELGGEHESLLAGCGGVAFGTLVTTFTTCAVLGGYDRRGSQPFVGVCLGLVFIVTTIGVARALAPKRVVVGQDGLLLETFFGRRWIPIASIVSVKLAAGALLLRLSGSAEIVRLAWGDAPQRVALCERIEDAIDRASHAEHGKTSTLFARGARGFHEWREALKKLARAGLYRDGAVSTDALLAVATSHEASPEDRVGAAMLLGYTSDEDAKKRLRIAVEGMAEVTMRVAMERASAADEEDAAVEEALMTATRKAK